MASITVRNLDEHLKQQLRVRAARNNRSMEEEVREILRLALAQVDAGENLATRIRKRFEPLGGLELPELPREPIREPDLDDGT